MQTLIEALSYTFFVRALIVGSVFAIICALLGIFVVLRKESIVGHAIANVSFLGIALGLYLGIDVTVSAIMLSLVAAGILSFVQQRSTTSNDSWKAIFAQSSMALAIVIVSLLQGYRADVMQYLFGDILAISSNDVVATFLLGTLVFISVILMRKKLLQTTFNKSLAKAAGNEPVVYETLYTFLVALVIAIGIKIVGAILVASFLIIPANIAKLVSKSFNQLLVISIVVSAVGTIVGLFLSFVFDVPSGAAIILSLSLTFFFLTCIRKMLPSV